MVGLITEQHLTQAEEEFPGISRFFEECTCKPRTFLELVALFEHWSQSVTLPTDDRRTAARRAIPQ